MEMNGALIVWECLQREGVDTVFGYPGGNVLALYDSLRDYPGIRHVLARHEQGACHMADGFSRASGRTGVTTVTMLLTLSKITITVGRISTASGMPSSSGLLSGRRSISRTMS